MRQIRVILAEDHPEIAQHLRMLLDPSYQVEIVADGPALIAAVARDLPDIIISDIAMPGMSGVAAARQILKAHPSALIIFSTILSEPAVIRNALAEGAQGYVMKSDAGDELLEAIDTVLRGGRYVSSSARAVLANR
jgi:DNA-binding NarL/FixJ family response regulator